MLNVLESKEFFYPKFLQIKIVKLAVTCFKKVGNSKLQPKS